MSFRDLFAVRAETRSRKRRHVQRAEIIPAEVERLEVRALPSAIVTGLVQHGVVVTNASIAGQTSVTLDGSINAQISGNANGAGLFIDINGNTSLQQLTLTGLQARDNGSAGVIVNLTNLQLDRLVIDASVFAGNGTNGSGAGLVLQLSNVQIGEILITNSRFNLNQFDGLHLSASNGTSITSLRTLTNIAAENATGSGLAFLASSSSITNFGVSRNTIRQNGSNGALIKLTDTPVLNLVVAGNIVTGNLGNQNGHGVFLDLIGSAVNVQIFENQLLDQQIGDGFRIRTQFSTAGLRNINLVRFDLNTFAGNAGAGFFATLARDTTIRGNVVANTFSSNGGVGFGVEAEDTENAIDLTIGGLSQNAQGQFPDANTFTQNSGAAILLTLNDPSGQIGDTTGRVRIFRNLIEGTVAGSSALGGSGIVIRAAGTEQIMNGAARWSQIHIDRNDIRGNAGHGILFDISEDSQVTDVIIGNATGSVLRFRVDGPIVDIREFGDGNRIENNGLDGIHFIRRHSAVVRDVRILDNVIQGNRNGIFLTAQNTYEAVATAATRGNLVSLFVINNNQLRNNTLNGVHLHTVFNAVMRVDIYYNLIDGNGLNGIRATGVENNVTDFENIGGTWIKNRISGNALNGIAVETVAGAVHPLQIGVDGQDVSENLDSQGNQISLGRQSLGNYILQNGEDGIDITSTVTQGGTFSPLDSIHNRISVVNNRIIDNGRNALAAGIPNPYTAGKGIDIEVMPGDLREIQILRNVIDGNAGDGIEIRNRGGTLGLLALGNTVDSNGGRGVDMLNQAGASNLFAANSHIVFGDGGSSLVNGVLLDNRNQILRNGLEGFYIVNTASHTQAQDVDARVDLLRDGGLDVAPNMMLDLEANVIRDNGTGIGSGDLAGSPPSTLSGTGLVLRVGTSNSAEFHTTTPDITGEANPFSDEAASGVGTNDSEFGNGRVNARVVNNQFSGNGGDDVFIESFTSTVDPPTTPGTWNQTDFKDFEPTYRRDPLARLNLVFFGNEGESLDVVRGPGDAHGSNAGAMYNNAEPDFKSRNQKTAPNPSGPFNSASRPRNAQRVAGRFTLSPVTGPNTPDSTFPFLYDGIGASTFRVESNWGVNGFTSNQLGDDFSVETSFINHEFVGPFGATIAYDEVTPGTFSFLTATVDDVVVNEASGTVTFTVTLSEPPQETLLIGYRTLDGTAISGVFDPTVVDPESGRLGTYVFDAAASDFQAAEGTLTFNPGQTTQQITIDLNNNSSFDRVEEFYVELLYLSGFGVRLVDSLGVATISPDSDSRPTVNISDTTVFPEGDVAEFTVTLSNPSSETVFVDFSTSDGTARDGQDYLEQVGTLIFNPGETSKTIQIDTLPDQIVEAPETFQVRLSNARSTTAEGVGNALTIADEVGIATIFDTPFVELPGDVFANGYGSGTSLVGITITLSQPVPSGQSITLNYSTSNGSALAGSDYIAGSGSIIFNAGEQSKTVLITVNRDTLPEGNEFFFVNFTDGGNAVFAEGANTEVRVVIREPGEVAGADAGGGPAITVFDGPGATDPFHSFFAFDPVFRGGVRVATGDMNGDGFPDIIAAAGPGGGPNVRVYDGVTFELISSFFAFPTAFRGGVNIATGDVDGDGTLEIIAGADAGGGPGVGIFDAAGNSLGQFFAFDSGFRGGVRVATGDVDGDGNDEIIVGSGPGQEPLVRVFDADDPLNPVQKFEFLAFVDVFRGGVTVTTGDFDGNGTVEIIAGASAGGGPDVRVFDGTNGALLERFYAFDTRFRGGVRVASVDLGAGGDAIVVGAGPGGGPHVQYFRYDVLSDAFVNVGGYFAFPVGFRGGVFVAGRGTGDGTAGSPLQADTSVAPSAGPVVSISQGDLAPVVDAALDRFESAGLSASSLEQLGSVEFLIADLGGTLLGLARPGVVLIDDDAAGYGWFVDYSPMLDEEFGRDGSGTLTATGSLAAGRMDLLTTVLHELGHELGWTDLDAGQHANDLMTGTLRTGVRRDLDSVFATEDLFDELLTA